MDIPTSMTAPNAEMMIPAKSNSPIFIFAYVGGAMTTLVINYAYDLSYRQLANSYVIGIEIMQGLSGSLGVVLTVPITALIASFLAVRKK